MWSSSVEPSIEDDTVSPVSVLEAELAPVSEMASTETAINSSAKRECGFTRYPLVSPFAWAHLLSERLPIFKHRSLDRGRAPAGRARMIRGLTDVERRPATDRRSVSSCYRGSPFVSTAARIGTIGPSATRGGRS